MNIALTPTTYAVDAVAATAAVLVNDGIKLAYIGINVSPVLEIETEDLL